MFKKYLMSTAAFAPPNDPAEGVDDGFDGHQEIEEPAEREEGLEQDAADSEGADETEDAEADDEGSVDDAPPRRPNRAQQRIQTLTTTAREAKDKADRLERELAEFRAQQRQQTQPQGESPEARAARRALIDPTEVLREDLRESETRTRQMLQQAQLENAERSDQAEYASIVAARPALKKFEAEVERIRLEQKANGNFVPRKVLLELAVGRAALAQAGNNKPRQQAQQRIERQQGRPAPARGDTATARGRQGDSLEKRLEDVPI